MPVTFKDYYETLGVKRDATADQIKRAFRKLAQQYHPDRNKAADAEKKFREVNEAYEVLGDPDKRAKYDELGADWKNGQQFRGPGGSGSYGGQGFSFEGGNFSDFFEALFGHAPRSRSGRAGAGRAGASGGARFEDILRGQGFEGFDHAPPAEQESDLLITLDEAYRGGTRQLQLQTHDGQRKTLDVKIPPGTTDGSRIRLRGESLVLRFKIAPHPTYTLDGRDLTTEVKLTPAEAALGAKVDVPTMDGFVTLTIPPGTSSGAKLRLRGKGLPARKAGEEPGDLFARVAIAVPKTLSDAERKLYEQLKETSTHHPRA